MIQKINKIRNVGLFKNAMSTPTTILGKTTIFYGENGRGKSTLANVFRSLGSGDTSCLYARKTIDAVEELIVELLIDNKVARSGENGKWSGPQPSILVFDAEFVEQNVHSGFEVRPDQRQNLLSFALGEDGVKLNKQLIEAGKNAEEAASRKNTAEKILKQMAGQLKVKDFISLKAPVDVDNTLSRLRSELAAALNIEAIKKLPNLELIEEISYEVDTHNALMGQILQDIEADAEAQVKQHFINYNEKIISWIDEGLTFKPERKCPFCGQLLEGVDLIKAYQSYFNEEFENLKKAITDDEKSAAMIFSEAVGERITLSISRNETKLSNWSQNINVPVLTINIDDIKKNINLVRQQLLNESNAKSLNPLSVIGTIEGRDILHRLYMMIISSITDYNKQVNEINNIILRYKSQLGQKTPISIKSEIEKIEIALERHKPAAESQATDYTKAEQDQKKFKEEKNSLRNQLDEYMSNILKEQHSKINELLIKFGASFQIERFTANYAAGTPRSEYALNLRGQKVELGSREDHGSKTCFSSALSDGDKRSLALAFFMVRAKSDAELDKKIIVIDDPVTSLDASRRKVTIDELVNLRSKASQLIALSHDVYFARDLCRAFNQPRYQCEKTVVIGIEACEENYSKFGQCDLEIYCESEYIRQHKIIVGFSEVPTPANAINAYLSIRPVLEGYLQRKYVGKWNTTQLGEMISQIRLSKEGEAIHIMVPIIKELEEINEYAREGHHGGSEGMKTGLDIGELQTFIKRTIDIIYS